VHELGFEIGSNDIEDDSDHKNAWCPNELVMINAFDYINF